MQASQKADPILTVLFKIMSKYEKDYCFPSQKKLIELLDIRRGVKKSRATLNRWLRVIEDEGYIYRKRRIKRDAVQGMIFKSTLYFITLKGCHQMTKAGVNCRRLFDRILNKIKGSSKRVQKDSSLVQDSPRGAKEIKSIMERLNTAFTP